MATRSKGKIPSLLVSWISQRHRRLPYASLIECIRAELELVLSIICYAGDIEFPFFHFTSKRTEKRILGQFQAVDLSPKNTTSTVKFSTLDTGRAIFCLSAGY
jgi:hypothetical protein